jgi:hypothetical protein
MIAMKTLPILRHAKAVAKIPTYQIMTQIWWSIDNGE